MFDDNQNYFQILNEAVKVSLHTNDLEKELVTHLWVNNRTDWVI